MGRCALPNTTTSDVTAEIQDVTPETQNVTPRNPERHPGNLRRHPGNVGRHPGLDPGSTFLSRKEEGGCRIKSGMTAILHRTCVTSRLPAGRGLSTSDAGTAGSSQERQSRRSSTTTWRL